MHYKFQNLPVANKNFEIKNKIDSYKTEFLKFIHQILMSQLTSIITFDNDDFIVTFSFLTHNPHLNISIVLSDFSVITKNDWQRLVTSTENNEIFTLNFCTSNGNVSICTKIGFTYFTVGKYGAGGDGEMTFKLENKLCIDAFKTVLNVFY